MLLTTKIYLSEPKTVDSPVSGSIENAIERKPSIPFSKMKAVALYRGVMPIRKININIHFILLSVNIIIRKRIILIGANSDKYEPITMHDIPHRTINVANCVG
ncbi:hypothetical protein KAM333_28550 [Aeromonas caviae]|nr:hypothetical protein KAM333_28550 [Aeromonas caviae]